VNSNILTKQSTLSLKKRKHKGLDAVSHESLDLSKKLIPVLLNLFMCRKKIQLYKSTHPKVLAAAEEVARGLHEAMLDRKIISLDLSEKHFLYDNIIIDHNDFNASEDIYKLIKARTISRINFGIGVSGTDIVELLTMLLDAPAEEKRHQLNNRLHAKKIITITLEENIDNNDNDVTIEEGEFEVRILTNPRQLYLIALDIVKETQAEISANSSFDIWKIDYLINSILYHIKKQQYDLLTLATVRHLDSFEYTHPVNVAILSTYLGSILTDDPMRLQELARAAFLHDCALLTHQYSSEMNDGVYNNHPIAGAQLIDRFNQIEKLVVVCTYEHHLQYDGKGFPALGARQVNLFSSIIATTDMFDRIMNSNQGFDLQTGINDLLKFSGTSLEPVVTNAFINMLGKVPAGTIVKLTTGEFGWVRPPETPQQDELKIQISTDRHGVRLAEGRIKKLSLQQFSQDIIVGTKSTPNTAELLFHWINETKISNGVLAE
jgi:HD-GYP domain-containing protein (c-di-GMP phosphodiesterase class II)